MTTVPSYLIEFFIRSCSALASHPCSPGTRGGRGIPVCPREGRVTPGSSGGRVTPGSWRCPGSRGGRETPGSGSWCSPFRGRSSSIVVRFEREEEQRQATRVGESRSDGVPPRVSSSPPVRIISVPTLHWDTGALGKPLVTRGAGSASMLQINGKKETEGESRPVRSIPPSAPRSGAPLHVRGQELWRRRTRPGPHPHRQKYTFIYLS